MTRSVKDWKPITLSECNIIEQYINIPDTDDIMFDEDYKNSDWYRDKTKSHLENLLSAKRVLKILSPYKNGDVVWACTISERKRFLITHVFTEYQDRADKYILKYRAQPYAKSTGSFSKGWQFIYPSYIYRGYKSMEEV